MAAAAVAAAGSPARSPWDEGLRSAQSGEAFLTVNRVADKVLSAEFSTEEFTMALMGPERSTNLGGAANQFKAVLTKLASDKGYLQSATMDPKQLLRDYPDLTIQELDALRDAAVLSGVDMSNIDPLHVKIAGIKPGQPAIGGDITACCCCCCCGVTGAIERI